MAKILVVEDDPPTIRLLKLVLGSHELILAASFEEAMTKIDGFSVKPFDLAIIDCTLAKTDPRGVVHNVSDAGIQVAERLSSHPETAHILIIIATGLDDENTSRRIREASDAILYKPYKPKKLIETIERLLETGTKRTGGNPSQDTPQGID
ncbi:MAG: response regulator [Candidatus Berkelbacteria bacterium]|nr:response regulator [Candidatus Berkelbacteria bacterium]